MSSVEAAASQQFQSTSTPITTTTTTPSSLLSSQLQNNLHQFIPNKLQTIIQESHESYKPEYDEEEAAISSGAETHGAITPISDSHPPTFVRQESDLVDSPLQSATTASSPTKPFISSSFATFPRKKSTLPSTSPVEAKTPPTPTRPTASLKRTMSDKLKGFFRRSNSHHHDAPAGPPVLQPRPEQTVSPPSPPSSKGAETPTPNSTFDVKELAASVPSASLTPGPSYQRKPSISVSAHTSPWHSPSVTPGASNGSPSSTIDGENLGEVDPKKAFQANRSQTGFGSRKSKITFSTPFKNNQNTSNSALDQIEEAIPEAFLHQPDFSRPAETGAGLKSRRLSINLPDEFQVDTIELDKEFSSASKLPGRSKTIGTGATCNVKLYTRKGHGDEIYAVKEFRKKGATEDANEYDKKVKSEYTIAHSLHHPNIVECVRLCTHAGRWNVVMEYCSVGEVFSLVEKNYLQLDDKLCIFKQTIRGVAYLHSHGIAHRDIKLENLLMTEGGKIKITDFGVSEVFTGEHPGIRAAGGECGKNIRIEL